jgi:hypothetical protein
LNLNLEQLDWIKASKVAALNNDDPFPNDPQTSYRIVDIFEDFENIPSPIKPQNREFIFECVWSVAQVDDEAFESKLGKFSDEINVLGLTDKLNFTIDNETNSSIYLRCTYTPKIIKHLSTSENLDQLIQEVSKVFKDIENSLPNSFPNTTRTTKSYRLSELGVFLDFSK